MKPTQITMNPPAAILSTLYGYDNCIGGVNNFDTDEEYMKDLIRRNCTVVEGADGKKITNVADAFSLKGLCGLLFKEEWMDWMPVTFNFPLVEEPDKEAIELTLTNGEKVTPVCVTLAPANEENEKDTLLILGQFGDGPINTVHPAKLTVVGDLRLKGPNGEINGKSLTFQNEGDMNYLDSSVRLVYARMWDVKDFSESSHYPGWPLPSSKYPNSCSNLYPATSHVIKMAFSGGITLDGVHSVLPDSHDIFTVKTADGLQEIPYLGLGDLGKTTTAEEGEEYVQDGDNYLDICLDLKDTTEVLAGNLLVDLNCDGPTLYPPKGNPYGCKSQQVILTSENTYGYYIKMWQSD